jgi:hypothetical protein
MSGLHHGLSRGRTTATTARRRRGGPRWRRHDSGRRQWRGDERRRSSSRSARATEGFDDFDVRGFEVLHDPSSTTGVVVARSLAADV